MNIEIRHLRTFVVLAEELHFGKAAERLRITQPSLTQQIQRLESNVGGKLFERSTRRVELTPTGKKLLQRAQEILSQFDEVFSFAAATDGTLSLGFCGTLGFELLAPVLARARIRMPGLSITARGELTRSELLTDLRSGQLDCALAYGPVTDPQWATAALEREPLGVLLAIDHPLAAEAELDITDVAGERLVVGEHPPDEEVQNRVVRVCLDAGFRPTSTLAGDPLTVQAAFVAAGTGVAVLPRSASAVVFPGTRFVPLRDPVFLEVVAVWPRNRSCAAVSELLI